MNARTFLLAVAASLLAIASGQAQSRGEGRASGIIGSRDTVEIRVFREDDLTVTGQLSEKGTITLPLIGAVKIAGISTDAAARAIEAKLRDGYLAKPEVSVTIEARIRRTVTVLGQAQQPGVFELPADRPLKLVEVIGMAGGATRIANTRKISLKRSSGEVRTVNLKDITTGKTADLSLRDGDVLFIPEGIF